MATTYDELTNDPNSLIQYIATATNTSLYPDSNTIAIGGPVWCPRVYGKDLTAFEIASSGKVAISLNDIHTLDFSRSNYVDVGDYMNTIQSTCNYSFQLQANASALQIQLDAYSNNINITAASNISIKAGSGNMSFTTSNNTILSTSNNFQAEARSNINLNASKGAATISAHNSNMYLTMTDSSNTTTLYSSNSMFLSACNYLNVNTNSNINIGSLAGDFQAYADASNMYLTMKKTTNDVTLFTLSNMFISASNNYDLNAQSNINIGALGGDLKAYADSSNMYLTMETLTDNVTLYTLSNMFVSASNNYNLNAQSNINIGALGGDVKVYSQKSNMYLTMTAATNNVALYASNNMNVSISNNLNIQTQSNISVGTVGGDYRLYVNSSNMFMRMSATTDSINVFSSNNTIFSASNNFNVYALSNLTLYTSNGSIAMSANSSNMLLTMDSATNDTTLWTSNNMFVGASNSYNLNVDSNINIGALSGDLKAYADSSNMYLTMEKTTDTVTLYTLSNMFVSASNNYSLNAQSNINVGALGGDVKVYSQKSNMFLTMTAATNNVALYASNNLSVSVSNSYNNWVNSNLTFSTKAGDVLVYANSSNMFLTMNALTNNTSLYTSNNLTVSVSNSFNTWVNSNLTFSTKAGSMQMYVNSSNMFMYMDHTTNNIGIFSSNDTSIGVSNNLDISVNSNINISTTYGSYNLYINSSNMFMTMDYITNNTTLFTSNNYQIGVSNNLDINVKSNINIGAQVGDLKLYSTGSNMLLTMCNLNNNLTMFASNNMLIGASNSYNLNANSNILLGALAGDFKVYSDKSNMFLTMDHTTDNIAVFSSNNTSVSVSNNLNIFVHSNIAASANKGSVLLYANNSNMYMTMDFQSNNVAVYASNNILLTASNSYTLSTYSNVSLSADLGSLNLYSSSSNMSLVMDALTLNTNQYTSNDMNISVSNNYNLNVNSNINIGALAGDFNTYADASNMYLTMARTTDTVTLYTSSNMFMSASNNYNLNAKSNINIGALNGDIKAYADSSNMYLTMEKTTDNVTLYTLSNMFVSASNNYNLNTHSNIYAGALAGDIKLYANSSNMYLTMDHLTNTETLYTANQMSLIASNAFTLNALSNVTINAVTSNVTIFASNTVAITASNNFTLNVHSNIDINAYTSNITVFASNTIAITASNDFTLNTNSNINIGALVGDIKAYADSSNMYLTMEKTTDNVTLYTLSNMFISASNNYNLNAQSNINVGALGGDVKVYSQLSNMYLTMTAATNNIAIFASNNLVITASNSSTFNSKSNINVNAFTSNITVFASNTIAITASNNFTLNTNSNINIGALVGDIKAYADSSNMYLTMEKTTDNVTLYTLSNMFISASNNYNLNAQSNINVGALGGDVKVYSQLSNMYLTMTAATNNIDVFASNNLVVTASNDSTFNSLSNINVNAFTSNITVFASNTIAITASNNFTLNTNSNINIGALVGDIKAYADSSNMYLTMEKTTDNVTLYTLSNMFISASNNYNLNAQSNVNVGALGGDVKVYSQKSNMFLTMTAATNNIALYASNNLVVTASNSSTFNSLSNINVNAFTSNITVFASNTIAITASNDFTLNTNSNINIGSLVGDLKAYADSSNMYLTMEKTTDNVTLYTLSNMFISASNNYDLNAQSNVNIGALGGDFKAYADSSNMYLTMETLTDNVKLYTLSNMFISASNNYNLNAQSNINVGALGGDVKVYSQKSNMFLTMTAATNNVDIFASNNLVVTASNSSTFNSKSNITVNAFTSNITVFASNTIAITASNNFTLNTASNLNISTLAGDYNVYANSSNMFLTMNSTTNNTTLFTSNNMFIDSSNNLDINVNSNVTFNALSASMNVFAKSNLTLAADSSNMYINMNAVGDSLFGYSLSNINLSASNNMFLDASSNINITMSNMSILSHHDISIVASNNITISGSNGVFLNFATINLASSNNQQFTAQSNIEFFITSASNDPASAVFTVQGNQVLIRGDMVITGDITTSNVFSTTVIQESLKVADTTIVLASTGSNFSPTDGPFDSPSVNSGAGIKVDGVPSYFDSNILGAYDKTLKWVYGTGNGLSDLGKETTLSTEPIWEVKGGAFQLTHQKIVPSGGSNIVQDVSFKMRVGSNDELEFVKTWWYSPSNGYVTKRVARFGRIL